MKQSGNTIQNSNLQEFLDSAANALQQGQRQFYTPPAIAEAICRPLPALRRHLIADLHFGSGALATASGAHTALGVEIDARVKDLHPPSSAKWILTHADLTHWYPLAAETDLRLPFILINPPFSLQWHSRRLAALAESDVPGVPETYRRHPRLIDSTLASLLIALDRLTRLGEGLILCNGNTARRLLGPPEDPADTTAPAAAIRRHIWMWLEIPGLIFENQMTDFPTAVLYFSRSHGQANHHRQPPLHLRSATGDAAGITAAFQTPEVWTSHLGGRYRYDHEFPPRETIDHFRAVAAEYAVRHRSAPPEWNIRIDDSGRLRTHLTPFQKTSRRLDRQLIANLQALNLKTPISLCVTATSRTALRQAAESGVWTIQPQVHTAIAAAIRQFESHGAPFYTPSPVQALGWVDEHSALTCARPGIGDCLPGHSYPITCTVEPTTWKGLKTNLAGDSEELQYHGKELLVTLTDHTGTLHHFHYRKDDATGTDHPATSADTPARHHHISALIEHFTIPIPQDIVTLHPGRYQTHLATLAALEHRINQNLATALAEGARSADFSPPESPETTDPAITIPAILAGF